MMLSVISSISSFLISPLSLSFSLSLLPLGYTNDKLAGVTLFSLAAPECLEELFKSIARLLSTAALDEKNPAYFATAAARAAPLSLPVCCNKIVRLDKKNGAFSRRPVMMEDG